MRQPRTMPPSDLDADLHRRMAGFFDDFVEAFRHFDGPLIAQRYHAPYSALHAGGEIDLLATGQAIGEYFHRIVQRYHADGCRACRWRDLHALPVGSESAFVSVSWDLLRADGTVGATWRESYSLTRIGGAWRIVASMDHVD